MTDYAPICLVAGAAPITQLGMGMGNMTDGVTAHLMLRDTEAEGIVVREPGTGLIAEFDLADYISSKKPYLDPQSKCALASAAIAVDSASIVWDEVDTDRCGVSYASALGNLDTLTMFQNMVSEKGLRLASPVLFGHTYPNTTASLLAIEFGLRGFHQNFCGGRLCGAQALEAAFMALRAGRADMMLAGGGDVVRPETLRRLQARCEPDDPIPAQGMGLLLLETQKSAERREGFAYCELGSVVCYGTAGARSADDIAAALDDAVQHAMDEAEIWEGDVGILYICRSGSESPAAAQAEAMVLSAFSEVPTNSAKYFTGETFGASYPLEIIAAADVLNNGMLPPKVSFSTESRGVEFWVEERPEPLMGHAALVVGCSDELVAATVLRSL